MKRRGADARRRHRLRRALSGAGALRRRGLRRRRGVPAAVGLRRRRARRALRHRAVHGRALSSAASAARARPAARARRRATCWSSSRCCAAREASAVAPTTRSRRRAIFERPGYPEAAFHRADVRGDQTNWWIPNRACAEAMLRSAGFAIDGAPGRRKCSSAGTGRCADARAAAPSTPAPMIESVMFWNEPNNLSHWDFELDPRLGDVRADGARSRAAGDARREPAADARARRHLADRPGLPREHARARACSTHVDVVAVHGFPLDWNHWTIHEWPAKLDEIRAVTDAPLWVSEVGVSTFGAEEVQEFGLRRTAELLPRPRRPDSLVQPVRSAARVAGDDAPPRGRRLVVLPALLHGAAARGRHAEAGGAAFRRVRARTRHLSVVPLRGSPARRRRALAEGLGVRQLRTGLSWAD